MLRRSHRLNGRQFEDVMKKGRVTHSPFFVARVLSVAGEKSRLAAVVPVKIARTSPERHLVRRRIYEAARNIVRELPAGTAVVLFAKSPVLSKKPQEIAAELRQTFAKAGLIRS